MGDAFCKERRARVLEILLNGGWDLSVVNV